MQTLTTTRRVIRAHGITAKGMHSRPLTRAEIDALPADAGELRDAASWCSLPGKLPDWFCVFAQIRPESEQGTQSEDPTSTAPNSQTRDSCLELALNRFDGPALPRSTVDRIMKKAGF